MFGLSVKTMPDATHQPVCRVSCAQKGRGLQGAVVVGVSIDMLTRTIFFCPRYSLVCLLCPRLAAPKDP